MKCLLYSPAEALKADHARCDEQNWHALRRQDGRTERLTKVCGHTLMSLGDCEDLRVCARVPASQQ
jgi:hypothetical protein